MMREGARFTSAYTLGITCAPSRCSYLTGRLPAGFDSHGMAALPYRPISSLLKDADYSTAHFGECHPLNVRVKSRVGVRMHLWALRSSQHERRAAQESGI